VSLRDTKEGDPKVKKEPNTTNDDNGDINKLKRV